MAKRRKKKPAMGIRYSRKSGRFYNSRGGGFVSRAIALRSSIARKEYEAAQKKKRKRKHRRKEEPEFPEGLIVRPVGQLKTKGGKLFKRPKKTTTVARYLAGFADELDDFVWEQEDESGAEF